MMHLRADCSARSASGARRADYYNLFSAVRGHAHNPAADCKTAPAATDGTASGKLIGLTEVESIFPMEHTGSNSVSVQGAGRLLASVRIRAGRAQGGGPLRQRSDRIVANRVTDARSQALSNGGR